MKIFLIKNKQGEILKSKKGSLYYTLKGAKAALRIHLHRANRQIKIKEMQIKSEDFDIIEHELRVVEIHKL